MAASAIGSSSVGNDSSSSLSTSALGKLNLDDFLKMLLTELQTQDPLNPMDSTTMLTQIGQISQVGATQNLSDTLNSVLLGQSINNATSLIGKTINGLSDDGSDVIGKVDKVTIADGQPVLNVGTQTVQLKNVRSVLPDEAASSPEAAFAAINSTGSSADQLQQLLQQLQALNQTQKTPSTT